MEQSEGGDDASPVSQAKQQTPLSVKAPSSRQSSQKKQHVIDNIDNEALEDIAILTPTNE